MPKGLLPQRLNCPWRATATAAMVRSTVSVPMASIGAVRLMVSVRGTFSSIAAMPSWTTTTERAEALCAALRINTLIYSDPLTLYTAIPPKRMAVFYTPARGGSILIF